MANTQINPNNWNVSQLVGPLPAFYANQVNNAFTAQAGNLYLVTLSASSAATLPDATQNPGAIIAVVLKTAASHTLTVSSAVAGQTIGGASSVALAASNNVLLVASDGSNYDVLASSFAALGAAAYENLGGNIIDDGAGNLKLANTAVTPGTFSTLSSITIAADGRITAYTA